MGAEKKLVVVEKEKAVGLSVVVENSVGKDSRPSERESEA